MKVWKTSRREIAIGRTLIMGILNVTPDSFSDGGSFVGLDEALRQAERMIEEGADIIDVGGESTRPASERVSAETELERVVPVIGSLTREFDVPVSIDTSRAVVAEAALSAGAEIVNDVSGLIFDEKMAPIVATFGAGVVVMHLRGEFATMHKQETVEDVMTVVSEGLRSRLAIARAHGIADDAIVLDVGIGFSKTFRQNLELVAKLDKLKAEFDAFPILVGASRKSFIGRILGDAPTDKRLAGSLAAAVIAAWQGADIVRVHDVRETAEAIRVADAIRQEYEVV